MHYEAIAKRYERFAIEHAELAELVTAAASEQPEDDSRIQTELDAIQEMFVAEYCRWKAERFRQLSKARSVSAGWLLSIAALLATSM